jgi:hypothetical protein
MRLSHRPRLLRLLKLLKLLRRLGKRMAKSVKATRSTLNFMLASPKQKHRQANTPVALIP